MNITLEIYRTGGRVPTRECMQLNIDAQRWALRKLKPVADISNDMYCCLMDNLTTLQAIQDQLPSEADVQTESYVPALPPGVPIGAKPLPSLRRRCQAHPGPPAAAPQARPWWRKVFPWL